VKNIFLILFFVLPAIVSAQEKKISPRQQKKAERREKINQLIKQEEEGALVFNKQSAFSIKLNTDGYGIAYEKGKYKTITKTNLWWVELGEHKHVKEMKFAKGDPQFGFLIGNPYVYGKINNFYNFKLGFGQQRLIGGKGTKNGVATSLIYGGGLSVALMKPYLLDVKDATGVTKTIKYQDDSTLFLNQTQIIGAAGFTKGFSNMKYIPGIHVRTSLRFDYGRYNEMISAMEVGINAEYYTKEIEQMAQNPYKKFFFNAYLALTFGRRK
jgi:hypothetical protein